MCPLFLASDLSLPVPCPETAGELCLEANSACFHFPPIDCAYTMAGSDYNEESISAHWPALCLCVNL